HQGARGPLHGGDARRHELLASGTGRGVDAAPRRRRGQAARRPAGHDHARCAPPSPCASGAMTDTAVYAAGGVVWRRVDGRLLILVIHRTAYADVTLPKGKVDPGETLAETAVREILEETGIRVALGIPVGVSRYRMPSKRQ